MQQMRQDAVNQDKEKDKLRAQIKQWKNKYELEKSETEFYHKSAFTHKRKNKLLKLACSRLQKEYDGLRDEFAKTDNELRLVNSLQEQIAAV